MRHQPLRAQEFSARQKQPEHKRLGQTLHAAAPKQDIQNSCRFLVFPSFSFPTFHLLHLLREGRASLPELCGECLLPAWTVGIPGRERMRHILFCCLTELWPDLHRDRNIKVLGC